MTIVRFRRFRTFDQMFSWKIMCVQCCNILASGENICAVHHRQSCQHYFASVYFFLRNNSSPLYTFQVFTATKLCFYFISVNVIFGEYVTICIWASGVNIFAVHSNQTFCFIYALGNNSSAHFSKVTICIHLHSIHFMLSLVTICIWCEHLCCCSAFVAFLLLGECGKHCEQWCFNVYILFLLYIVNNCAEM